MMEANRWWVCDSSMQFRLLSAILMHSIKDCAVSQRLVARPCNYFTFPQLKKKAINPSKLSVGV